MPLPKIEGLRLAPIAARRPEMRRHTALCPDGGRDQPSGRVNHNRRGRT
jgi:hypothetical protein